MSLSFLIHELKKIEKEYGDVQVQVSYPESQSPDVSIMLDLEFRNGCVVLEVLY